MTSRGQTRTSSFGGAARGTAPWRRRPPLPTCAAWASGTATLRRRAAAAADAHGSGASSSSP